MLLVVITSCHSKLDVNCIIIFHPTCFKLCIVLFKTNTNSDIYRYGPMSPNVYSILYSYFRPIIAKMPAFANVHWSLFGQIVLPENSGLCSQHAWSQSCHWHPFPLIWCASFRCPGTVRRRSSSSGSWSGSPATSRSRSRGRAAPRTSSSSPATSPSSSSPGSSCPSQAPVSHLSCISQVRILH